MTKQEADALAERLVRVWAPMVDSPKWELEDTRFNFTANIAQELSLSYLATDGRVSVSLEAELDYQELLFQEGEIVRCHTHYPLSS